MSLKPARRWSHICRVIGEYVATIEIALLATYMILGARW
jgi:hypothetical protein